MNPDNVKIEKANAIYEYNNNKLQRFTTLFRFIELIIFLIVISRLPIQLPFNINVSTDLLKGISFSSKYVFVLGNMIILILLFKSRVVENGDHNDKIDVYDEYVRSCEKRVVHNSTTISTCETNNLVSSNDRKICRSQSGSMVKVKCQHNRVYKKLRRSVTDKKIVKSVDGGGGGGGETVVVSKDELSSDEFRRTVEAFIARQQQSLRDEELAPVPYIGP
uniref:uncharacterized protein LOC122593648 n=1 Tax=Erigeron canadensis TaxID=72917 RepID=UPI001CB8CEB2|nr:uncharacterized protein LOC122593648 [Erigeron canadensis]